MATASAGVQWQGAGEQQFGSLTLGDLGFTDQPSYYLSNYRLGLTYTLDWATLKGPAQAKSGRRVTEAQIGVAEASLATQRSQLDQMKAQTDNLKIALRQSQDALQRAEGLAKQGLIPREQLERAQNDVKMRETDLKVNEQAIKTQEQRIKQEEANLNSAQYDLNKVRIVSNIDGLVTRRNIEEGETAVVGTMNNAGTVLLTIADLSVIETEIEVDETDIPFIHVGQTAKVTIDALPDREFPGRVTEVGNSPIQVPGASAAQRATNFKVVVTIDGEVPGMRPGFTCTAVITTATRQKSIAVPIQAMTLREVIVDQEGHIVRPPTPKPGERKPPTTAIEPKEGQTRKEFEGVFLIQDNRAVFVPVKTGIAGEKYFEVLDGIKEGDQVITGPFQSVRGLKDGDEVKVEAAAGPRPR